MPKSIEIYIDRIVMDGFGHMNIAELNGAIVDHLFTLVSKNGLPERFINRTYHQELSGGQMDLPQFPKSKHVGRDIANGIYNGMNRVRSIPGQQTKS